MLHFEGTNSFPQNVDAVIARLSDPAFLVGCVPGVESVASTDAREARCVLRPGFSFVRGTLDLTVKVAEPTEPGIIKVHLHSKGIGSSSEVEATLKTGVTPSGSEVRWFADITNLGGLLKAVPRGLIEAAAKKVIADAWIAIESRLDAK